MIIDYRAEFRSCYVRTDQNAIYMSIFATTYAHCSGEMLLVTEFRIM
jgi:hypothetical protein